MAQLHFTRKSHEKGENAAKGLITLFIFPAVPYKNAQISLTLVKDLRNSASSWMDLIAVHIDLHTTVVAIRSSCCCVMPYCILFNTHTFTGAY